MRHYGSRKHRNCPGVLAAQARASAMRVDPSSLCLGSEGQEHRGQVGDRSGVQRGQTGEVGERLEPHDG